MADWWVKQGDSAPPISQVLVGVDGNPANLAGCTVKFVMRPMPGGDTTIYDAATIDQVSDGADGSKGKVHYNWKAEDLAVPGGYYAEWEVTFAGGTDKETFPNDGYITVAVVSDLGVSP